MTEQAELTKQLDKLGKLTDHQVRGLLCYLYGRLENDKWFWGLVDRGLELVAKEEVDASQE